MTKPENNPVKAGAMECKRGDWEKLKELGAGAFGVVSLWKNSRTDQLLALKVCRKREEEMDEKTKENWWTEVDKMRNLHHTNIIRILELPGQLASLSTLPILCMEFCSKGDLRKELCKTENICGLPEEKVRAVLRDVAAGIQYLHSVRIIHRDLKPENIVMQEQRLSDNTTRVVYKLIDLGFAKEWDQSSLCSTIVGTLQYIAPELYTQANSSYSRSVDYWSLGLVCHEVITGFRPFLPGASPSLWVDKVSTKSHDHICIWECADGSIEYLSEIFSENHITQELKYDMEKWLRLCLEWDGTKRGKSLNDGSLVLFTKLEKLLTKKIVTVYCIKKLEWLSYHIDDSTRISTLMQWIERDTGIYSSSQILVLPCGDILRDHNLLLLPHLDNDAKLVAMLYVVSREEGVRLPQVETLQSKHPPLVKSLLQSPSDKLSYYTIRRTWADSVFFVQTVLDTYRAFIEAYSAKMLSLIEFEKKRLLDLQMCVNSTLQNICTALRISKMTLDIDLEYIRRNQFSHLSEYRQKWNSTYTTLDQDFRLQKQAVDQVAPLIACRLQQIHHLQSFDEPGMSNIDNLSHLLMESSKLCSGLTRLPCEERDKLHDPSSMVPIIYNLWQVITEISNDQPFSNHLKELHETDCDVNKLIRSLSEKDKHLTSLLERVNRAVVARHRDVWSLCDSGGRMIIEQAQPPLPTRNRPVPPHSRVHVGEDFLLPNHH